MKRRNQYDGNVFYSLTLVAQFGINMLVPILLLTVLGVYLDRKLGTWFITIILFFLGAAAGAQNVYRMAKRLIGGKDPADKKVPKSPFGENGIAEEEDGVEEKNP